jgi:hypothetical protein
MKEMMSGEINDEARHQIAPLQKGASLSWSIHALKHESFDIMVGQWLRLGNITHWR